jgi:hypothetical protein
MTLTSRVCLCLPARLYFRCTPLQRKSEVTHPLDGWTLWIQLLCISRCFCYTASTMHCLWLQCISNGSFVDIYGRREGTTVRSNPSNDLLRRWLHGAGLFLKLRHSGGQELSRFMKPLGSLHHRQNSSFCAILLLLIFCQFASGFNFFGFRNTAWSSALCPTPPPPPNHSTWRIHYRVRKAGIEQGRPGSNAPDL